MSMEQNLIAEYYTKEGAIEVYKNKYGYKYYLDIFNRCDASASNKKELKKIIRELGANPNKPIFGEVL